MGSALERYVRGLISYKTESCVMDEFVPDTGGEIDYVDKTNLKALEITISNKSSKEVYFQQLDSWEDYDCVLLTKDIELQRNNVRLIPFCKYVYEKSVQKKSTRFPV